MLTQVTGRLPFLSLSSRLLCVELQLSSLPILIERSYPSLRVLFRWYGVDDSLVVALLPLIHSKSHADRYIPIKAGRSRSAKRPLGNFQNQKTCILMYPCKRTSAGPVAGETCGWALLNRSYLRMGSYVVPARRRRPSLAAEEHLESICHQVGSKAPIIICM